MTLIGLKNRIDALIKRVPAHTKVVASVVMDGDTLSRQGPVNKCYFAKNSNGESFVVVGDED